MILSICSVCETVFKETDDGRPERLLSHGLCPNHYKLALEQMEITLKQMEEVKMDEYDFFPRPRRRRPERCADGLCGAEDCDRCRPGRPGRHIDDPDFYDEPGAPMLDGPAYIED